MTDEERFKVTKGQLVKLVEAIEGTDLQEVSLRPTVVERRKGILATYTLMDQVGEERRQVLVIGDGVVKL